MQLRSALKMDEKCIICEDNIISDRCEVNERGLKGLIKASNARKDGKSEFFAGKKKVVLHASCRKMYTRPQTIARDIKVASSEQQPGTSRSDPCLRSTQSQFDFKTKCLFCSETIDDTFYSSQSKINLHRRRQVYPVRTTKFDESLLTRAKDRNDEWGDTVARRISIVGDLHAADAMYHDDCYKKFFLATSPTGKKRGRPAELVIEKAMEEIYQYLEEKDDCQYSLDELMEQISGEKPTLATVRDKLKKKYGHRIIFSTVRKRKTVVCFRDAGEKILNDRWYTSKCSNEKAERERIVRTAGAILLEDMQSMTFETDVFPSSDDFCSKAEEMVPKTLMAFMDSLSGKKRDNEKVKKKLIAISHAIISTIRPRSFLSPVMHGIALFIYRKFGSKNLINLLARLGFSASYHDAQQLEISTIYHPSEPTPRGTFCQYIFDNADFNVATLDGLNTFHSMGGIKCITPAQALPPAEKIKRLKIAPSAVEVGKLGVLELQAFEKVNKNVLKHIVVKDLNVENPIPSDIFAPSLPDVLWMSGKWIYSLENISEVPIIPEWKGFMQLVCESVNSDKSCVKPLPFINSPPSDFNTVFTALKYAATDCNQQGLNSCFVTFDQPLYIKAREITSSLSDDHLFKTIIVRLGGFHMLMSYMGCIGHTMAGSGLKDVLSTVFAPNSVEKMLTGRAYSRAVRGHLLVQAALARILLNGAGVSLQEQESLIKILSNTDELTPRKVRENSYLTTIQNKLQNELGRVKENGPTAALWVQYFNMISIMKKFIVAEHSGDWNSHLFCAQQMIPFFHASGHFQYAKCTHLYVQDMLNLTTKHPDILQHFVEKGYFSINRSGSPWAAVWSDLVIEQTLMRSLKSSGGLTRGRGISDSVLSKWICGSSAASAICSSVEDFSGVVFSSGEQHVDFRASRKNRDEQDRRKISEWFNNHFPFPTSASLMSLSTGIIGNSKINCYQSLQIGTQTMRSFVGKSFADIKQSKKNVVLSLASMTCAIEVHNEPVVVDPLMIFQRTAIAKKSDEDLEDLLCYELSPFPLALFNEGGMRKSKKSALYDALPALSDETINFKTSTNVVDGGFLLHRVKWNVGTKFHSICDQYVAYIHKHYGENCTVVFDGYGDLNSTKRAEQKRRGSTKTSVDINFDENMKVTVQQEHFLANENNKTKLIHLLTQKMAASGIETKVATGDADTTIVRCGIEKSASNPIVAVIGEDVDLVVLLIALTPPNTNIYFLKPSRGKVETKIFSTQQLQELSFYQSILLLHAFSGCDTTSAIYKKSKATMVTLFKNQTNQMQELAEIFYNSSSTPGAVSEAGEKMFLAIYRAKSDQHDLNKHRYSLFLKSSTNIKADLSSLPPTRGSAQQHSLRVYLQIQQWLGNNLTPDQWGWARGEDGCLFPVKTKDPLAPDTILNNIFCSCTTGCGGRCGCRKAGIKCSSVCGTCHGTCTNSSPIEEEEFQIDDTYAEDFV